VCLNLFVALEVLGAEIPVLLERPTGNGQRARGFKGVRRSTPLLTKAG
jgi:hypothetical protein